jgi:hypothetical protein
MVESRGYSLLAYSAFKHHTHCFNTIYEHGKRYNLAENLAPKLRSKALQNWANFQTDEKFTALHFASYHGNLDVIRLLIDEMRATYTLKNVYGASVLHISA